MAVRKLTERLTLRGLEPNDVPELIELLTNDHIKQTYMLPDYERKEDARPLAERLVKLSQDKNRAVIGMDLDGRIIGFMNDVEIEGESVEMGYVVHPDCSGRGYCTEAFCGAIKVLFERGFEEVTAGAFEENAASIRVMEKCGMSRMDKSDEIEYRGRTHHCVYYHICK